MPSDLQASASRHRQPNFLRVQKKQSQREIPKTLTLLKLLLVLFLLELLSRQAPSLRKCFVRARNETPRLRFTVGVHGFWSQCETPDEEQQADG